MTKITMTAQQVKQARSMAYDGASVDEIVSKMELNYGPVYTALVGRTWRSIVNPPPVPGEVLRQNGLSERVCINCGAEDYKGGTTTRCGACYAFWWKYGKERDPKTINKQHHAILTQQQLARLYVRYCNGTSMRELAEDLPFSEETLRRRFVEAGFPRRKPTGHRQKLTAEIVRHARIMVHVEGVRVSEAAQMYGIHYQTMHSAVRGDTWRGAGGPVPDRGAEKRPCIRCEMMTSHLSGLCRFCRNGN